MSTPTSSRQTKRDIEREQEMHRLRTVDGWSLEEIANRFNVTRERVRQILHKYLGMSGTPPAAKAHIAVRRKANGARRRAEMYAQANTKAHQVIAAWKHGDDPRDIADRLRLTTASVTEVIRNRASVADRAARRRHRKHGAGVST